MPSTTGRSAIRLATLILLALLVGACGGDSASPTAAPTTTTTVAPTTTTVPPLNAKELAWLKGVSGVRTKVENSFQAKGSGPVTRAIMLESVGNWPPGVANCAGLEPPPSAFSRRIRSSERSSGPTTRAPNATPGRLGQ